MIRKGRFRPFNESEDLLLIAAIAVVVVAAVLVLAGVYALGNASQPDRALAAAETQEIH